MFGALDIMVKTTGAFQLVRKELVAESEQVNQSQVVGLSAPLHICIHRKLAIKVLVAFQRS